MKSATTELAKYLERKGVPVVGDPYVEFTDVPAGELKFDGSMATWMILGFFTLFRFSNTRWLVQWFQAGVLRDKPAIVAAEVVELLEGVVEGNRKAA